MTHAHPLTDLQREGTLVQSVVRTVRQVGEFIRREHRAFSRDQAELKSANDLVSYVDRGAEDQLSEALGRLIPGSGFIMEETGYHHADADAVWVIDPLDGTTNFVFGIPVFSISVALRLNGQTVIGVVYEVNRDELFLATRGGGATLNDARIRTGTADRLQDCLIATGFPFRRFGRVDEYMLMLRDFMLNTRGVRRLGSAAIDLAYTAMGRFDGFFETNLYPWDVAAGALLVEEAGGTVTDFFGGQDHVFGRTIVAAGTGIHPIMRELISRYARPEDDWSDAHRPIDS